MKTLIITSTVDLTVDLIINRIGANNFVRINYDRPKDWILFFSKDKLHIKSDVLDLDLADTEISKFIWRKPYFLQPTQEPYTEKFYKEEWKFLLHDIMFFFKKSS